MPDFNRHTLIYADVNQFCLEGTVAHATDDSNEIIDWVQHKHPFIIRRPGLQPQRKSVCCGLPLPPAKGKRRIGFELPVNCIEKQALPPTLKECLPLLDKRKHGEITRLLTQLEPLSITPRVVGSFAWQFLTHLNYITETSDLDLLFIVDSVEILRTLDQALEYWHSSQSARYDIEIMSPTGEGFLWKEYRQKTATVMLKRNQDVILVPRKKVLQ